MIYTHAERVTTGEQGSSLRMHSTHHHQHINSSSHTEEEKEVLSFAGLSQRQLWLSVAAAVAAASNDKHRPCDCDCVYKSARGARKHTFLQLLFKPRFFVFVRLNSGSPSTVGQQSTSDTATINQKTNSRNNNCCREICLRKELSGLALHSKHFVCNCCVNACYYCCLSFLFLSLFVFIHSFIHSFFLSFSYLSWSRPKYSSYLAQH